MRNNIYLLQYNNYYNRIIKREETLEDYRPYMVAEYYDRNFIPNDNINATHDLNYSSLVQPDYLIAEDRETGDFTCWFIIDSTRLANGQYRYTLHRDLIADYFEDLLDVPMFVEKARIRNIADPAIYNNENMSFNQIKVEEKAIKDETNCPWIVGYIPRGTTFDQEIRLNAPTKMAADITVSNLTSWEWYSKVDQPLGYDFISNTNFRFTYGTDDPASGTVAPAYNGKFTRFNSVAEQVLRTSDFDGGYQLYAVDDDVNTVLEKTIAPLQSDQYEALFRQWYNNNDNFDTVDGATVLALNNKVIYDENTKLYYRIRVRDVNTIIDDTTTQRYDITGTPGLVEYANNNINRALIVAGISTSNTWKMYCRVSFYKISLDQVTQGLVTNIPSNRNRLFDAPYDMFCIPYGSVAIRTSPLQRVNTVKNSAIDIATEVCRQLGEGAVYDLQLLPYCPCRELLNQTNGTIDAYLGSYNTVYRRDASTGESTTGEPETVMIWCQYSQFQFSRTYTSPTVEDTLKVPEPIEPVDKKVKNETSFLRLCSPNYNGVFEFNPMKNNGVDTWDISCVYRPFTPYIHVSPRFKEDSLYGNDYGDARGLTCGGDFSLTQMTNAWATYELNNKNFQASFDRQIENIEVNNSITRQLEGWQVATGTLSAAATGGAAGSVGGAIGAAIGAGVAGTASLAGGLADIILNEKLRTEALDYTKDQFGYNLQNIKAIPDSLRKISALNPQNKIFPFVELYKCSDIEEQALRDKIRYNGMTIMRIGTISEFKKYEPEYFKARLIRLENVGEFHEVSAIADELNKGVFI